MLLSDDELNAMQVEIDDWKARAEAAEAELARVRAGEPFGWYSAKEDDFMLDKIRKTHERLNSHTHRIGKYDTALFTAPQPAAQEPIGRLVVNQYSDSGIGIEFTIDKPEEELSVGQLVYATPPSAVPVVRQLVEALDGLFSGDVVVWSLGGSARPRAAIEAGQQYLKENGK